MHTTTRNVSLIIAALFVLAVLVGIAIPRGPIIRNSPFTRQLSAMQQICKKLRDYEYDHTNLKPEDMIGRSIADYVAMGVLSPEDATYIEDHQIKFLGFDPTKIGGDVPLLEAIYSKTNPPKRIVGYSDASVGYFPLDNKK